MTPSYPLFLTLLDDGGVIYAMKSERALQYFVDEELGVGGLDDARGWDASGERVRVTRDEQGGARVESEGNADIDGLRVALLEQLRSTRLRYRISGTADDLSTATPVTIWEAIAGIEDRKTARRIAIFFIAVGVLIAVFVISWLRSHSGLRP